MPGTAAVETDTAVQVARPGRAWLPAPSISCSGITLSDEGGQGERTRTRRYLGNLVAGRLSGAVPNRVIRGCL